MGSSVHEVLDPQSAVGALAICLISSCDYPPLFPSPYVHYGWLIKNTLVKKQRGWILDFGPMLLGGPSDANNQFRSAIIPDSFRSAPNWTLNHRVREFESR